MQASKALLKCVSLPEIFWKTMRASILLVAVVAVFTVVDAYPPAVAYCSSPECYVKNSYGEWNTRQLCKVSKILYPSNEQEMINAVAYGVKNEMKMKVVSKFSHSIPPLVCPGGDSGLLISTANYTHTINVNRASMEVTVDSGVQLQDMLDKIAEAELALPASPYWNGLSVGGILGTGSHGSSLRGIGSAVHDYVTQLRMIVPATAEEGYAKIVTLKQHDERIEAAKVSLGVLGVTSQVTLKLQPMFKRSVSNVKSSDENLENTILNFANAHEFADITWYPSKKKVIYRNDDRVAADDAGDGSNQFIGFQSTFAPIITAQRALEEHFESKGWASAKCVTSTAQLAVLEATGYGLRNNLGIFTGYPVIGFQHKMQAAGGCQKSASKLQLCPWDSAIDGLFYHEAGFSIPLDKIHGFIVDVKKLRDSSDASRLCGVDLYAGILLRYVKKSKAYLGKQEDAVDVGFTYYRSRNGTIPRLNQDAWEEIEQIGLVKYGGLPHWGKNKKMAFEDMKMKYPKLGNFVKVMKDMDPKGLFSSEWSDMVLGVGRSKKKMGSRCALEGMCVCSTDAHCAPEDGYYCKPGKVFPDARVCSKN